MANQISSVRTSYQGRVSNSGRGFGGGRHNLYRRGRGCRFNPTKPNDRGKCEAL